MSESSHDASSPLSFGEGSGMRSKRCPKCGETKSHDAFSRDKAKKDSLQSHCKACNAAYNAAHRDQQRARNATYYTTHRDRLLAYQAAHYHTHREQIRVYDAAYRATHRNRRRAHAAAYRAAHRDQLLAYLAGYRRDNPDVNRASSQRRRAKIKGNGGAGVSAAELKALRAAQAGICAYCRLHYIDPLQIDHVIPIDQGGPHEIANIVLACGTCNSSKGARTPEQWVNRWYYALDIARLM